ncbi:hypothetical protein FDB81_06440 [Clostridium sporogenes]|uniref:hypothetical protein n=1 Tax=Clostridium sporogenes TaxID=1509 RepID=UPI0013D3A15E|nr:hypothetical protein [Clostridium sporogenes]NFL75374.1 hypothetical protein [Clostridium sporogenes]
MDIGNVLKDHGVGIGKYGTGKTIHDYNLQEVYYQSVVNTFPQSYEVWRCNIAIDKDNAIWFSDGTSLFKMDSAGNQLLKIDHDGICDIIAYNDSIFTRRSYGRITCYNLSGIKIWEKSYEGYTEGFYLDTTSTIRYLYTSYSDKNGRYIMKISMSGQDTVYATMSSDSSYTIYAIRPNAIYYTRYKTLYKDYLPSVTAAWNYPTNEYSRYIAVDKSDNVYHGFGKKLYKFDKNGNVLWSKNNAGEGLIDYIFLDYRGFIYALSNNSYINKYDSNGLITKSIYVPYTLGYLISNEKDFIYVTAGSNVIKYNFSYKVIS